MSKINKTAKYIISIIFIFIMFLSILEYIITNNLMKFNNIIIFIAYILSLFLIIFIYRKFLPIFNKYHNIILIIITLIGVILGFSLLFGNYYINFDDYGNNYNNAISFATNLKFSTPNTIAMFPHLSVYILLLSLFFHLFDSGINVIIVLNLIFYFGTSILIYLITKRIFSKNIALLSYAFFLINPITLIWCTMPIGVTIFNFFLCLSYYFSYKLLDKLDNKKNCILFSFIVGLIFGLSNLFRPIMPVFIIAFVITIILKNNFKLCKEIILSIIIVIFSYILIGNVHSKILSNLVDQELPKIKYGWSVYVGSQYEYGGLWNLEASNIVSNKQENGETVTNIQKDLLDSGIKNFKTNGIKKNMKLFKYKFITLMGKTGRYSADSYLATKNVSSFFDSNYDNVKSVIICNLFNFILLITVLITSIKFFKSVRYDIIFLQLYIIGILIAQLFLEVSARYTLSFLVPFFILSFGFLYSEKEHKNQEKIQNKIFKKIKEKISLDKIKEKISLKKILHNFDIQKSLLVIISIITVSIAFLRPVLNFTFYSFFLLTLFLIIALLFIFLQKRFNNKYIPIIIFIITFLSRIIISFLFKDKIIQLSDFNIAYENSKSLLFNYEYYWTFPHWLLYPIILNGVYKILGISQLSGFIFNSLMISLSTTFIYLISNKIFKNVVASIMASIFYIFWLSNAFYVLIYTQEHIVITLLLISIYIFLSILDNNNFKSKCYLSILLGLILAFSAFFKDFSSIYIIAFICCLIIYLFSKNERANSLKNIGFVFLSFIILIISKNIIFNVIDIYMDTAINRNIEDFSLYVGFDRQSKGYYSSEIAAEYFDIIKNNNYDYKKIDLIAKTKFVSDIFNNRDLLPEIINEKHKTSTNGDYIKIWLVYESIKEAGNDSMANKFNDNLSKINNSYYYMIVFLDILGVIYLYKNKNIKGYLIPIIILGCMLVFLIVESQERYRYPIEMLYCILAGGGIMYIYNYLSKYIKIRRKTNSI